MKVRARRERETIPASKHDDDSAQLLISCKICGVHNAFRMQQGKIKSGNCYNCGQIYEVEDENVFSIKLVKKAFSFKAKKNEFNKVKNFLEK